MAKNYFTTHKQTVEGRMRTSAKEALSNGTVGYVDLFKGMIDTSGDLSTKLTTISGGGLGVFGKPNKSNLFSSTDFPVIEGEKSIQKSYSDGFMLISKVTSQMGAYIQNGQMAVEKLKGDTDALFVSHAMEDNDIFMGISEDTNLADSGIWGLANHPDVGRVDNTLGNPFEASTAEEIYAELKAQIFDFAKKVTPAGERPMQTRRIKMVFPPEIFLLIAMLEVVRGNETLNIFEALKKDTSAIGGVEFLNNASVSLIQPTLPALDGTKCAVIGYLDPYFVSCKLPSPTNLLKGAGGDASHIDHKTEYESLFVSKNLGLQLKNIYGVNEGKYKVLKVIQGL